MGGVKTVFRSLLWTVIVILLSCLIVETINMHSSATFMKSTMARAVEKSCDYFAAETYKTGGMNVDAIQGYREDENGDRHLENAFSGTFYHGATAEDIYEGLYGRNSEFQEWYNNDYVAEVRDGDRQWRNLDRLMSGLGANVPAGSNLTDADKRVGESYAETMMTPLNLGVPYLDEETVESICKWNLAWLLTNGKPENIHIGYNPDSLGQSGIYVDADGNIDAGSEHTNYVLYNGFRCYIDSFNITDIRYEIFDIMDNAEAEEFQVLTGVNARAIIGQFQDGEGNTEELVGERRYVGLAEINYTIDMDYVGITPMRRIMNYIAGADGITSAGVGDTTPEKIVGYEGYRGSTFDTAESRGVQQAALANKMYYYIVR